MIKKDKKFEVKEMILAVASLFGGKTEKSICEELEITPVTFSRWLEKYGEIGCQYNKLRSENEWLKKQILKLADDVIAANPFTSS